LFAVIALVAIVVVAARRRFYYGKFLDPDDLAEEQQYRRCRRHLR